MKAHRKFINVVRYTITFAIYCFFVTSISAQELELIEEKPMQKLAKNTFESVWIIDNQTVMVPIKGTFEFDIAHRFGKVNSTGEFDLYGLFAPSNIRLGLAYAPINNLFIGVGLTKDLLIIDGSLKYALLKQTAENWNMPISITYYGNMSVDMKEDPGNSLYKNYTDRLRYFNQLIIARKFNSRLSLQIAPTLAHQNFVYGFTTQIDSVTKGISNEMLHTQFSLSSAARYKITESIALIVNYDQPISKHTISNPNPNLGFGIEFGTSGHAFQIFAGNYRFLNPQRNSLFNNYSPLEYTNSNGTKIEGGNFVIGFNITRLWNL